MPPMASVRAARADADAESDAADRATAADEKREGDREHHADGSDERVCDFLVPLHGEGRDIEAGVMKAFNVTTEAAPAELESLADFAIEVGRRFCEFRKRSDAEG